MGSLLLINAVAKKSGCLVNDGRLRTRTFDRYLRLEQLPKVPRWREVVRTAYFVLSIPTIETETRLGLEHELEKTKALLKKAAID